MNHSLCFLCLLVLFLPVSAQAGGLHHDGGDLHDAGAGAARIVEIRFRGNFTVPDETLIRIGGIEVGMLLSDLDPEEVKQNIMRTGRFESADIARRYRSFSGADEIVLLITVKEKQSLRSRLMYFPILAGSDEYGFTYGFRSTAVDLLGFGERLSIPLTWGGTRRAALEGELRLENRFVDVLSVDIGLSLREHPFYRIGDFRKEARAGIRKRFDRLDISLESGWTDVSFGPQRADYADIGAGAVFDTRANTAFPRDAVYAGAAWKRLAFLDGGRGVNTYTVDIRGYKSVVGQTVLAGQFLHRGVDGPLPDWDRPFLGGANTLRGHRPGTAVGDAITTAVLELRVPLSPLRAPYHAGVDLFIDTGTVYDYGTSLRNAEFRHGAGIGGFFLFMGFGIKVDVAYDMRDSFRTHFSTGFRF
ncbi:MAG TPA: BamA/TamA family outer membrane protein [Acidobacteriota bacterium]|nr:BamA/TamA family outer membrane protein [Acidobacteriota bacterium]